MALVGVPLKTIFPYWVDVSNETLPDGWAFCNGQTLNSTQQDINPGGTYTVPDVRNKFLLGADLTKSIGAAGAAVGSTGASGIENPGGAPGPKATGGENDHQLTTAELAAHLHHVGSSNDAGFPSSYHGGGGGNGVGDSLTSSTGGDTAHENRPAFLGVVFIIKVKI